MTAMRGVLSPVLTPFRADLSVDAALLAAQCRWLQHHDVGAAIFGTNSEGNSLSAGERIDTLEELVAAGIDPARLMPGTGACAIDDAVAMTRACLRAGAAGVLVLPPFYYKNVGDEGLFAYFSEVVQRVGDRRLRMYLYHIPPVSQVPLGLALIERLRARYGETIAGVKDSGGQWVHTAALIERFAAHDFSVFAGSENFLLRTLRAGGAGCISATANVNPGAIAALCRDWQAPDADARQQRLDQVRAIFSRFPMIAAMKSAVAQATGIADWARVRPPLEALDPAQESALRAAMAEAGFSMSIHYPQGES